jgi:hypothetical protein
VLPSSGKGWETPTLLDAWTWVVQRMKSALSEGPNRVDVSFPSSEDGSTPTFRKVMFSSI